MYLADITRMSQRAKDPYQEGNPVGKFAANFKCVPPRPPCTCFKLELWQPLVPVDLLPDCRLGRPVHMHADLQNADHFPPRSNQLSWCLLLLFYRRNLNWGRAASSALFGSSRPLTSLGAASKNLPSC